MKHLRNTCAMTNYLQPVLDSTAMTLPVWGGLVSSQHRIKKVFYSSDTNVTQLTVLRQRCTFSGAEVYLLMFIKPMTKVKIVTSGATSRADINLRRTYRAIDSVATGIIPSLFCGIRHSRQKVYIT